MVTKRVIGEKIDVLDRISMLRSHGWKIREVDGLRSIGYV